MKEKLAAVLCGLWLGACGWAQVDGRMPEGKGRITDQVGPHHRLRESVRPFLESDGQISYVTNQFVEIGVGLNRYDAEKEAWVPAKAEFEQAPSGYLVARGTQHQLILAPDLNSGVTVDFLTPDGMRLQSAVYGIGVMDPESGKDYLLAEVKNSSPTLVSATEVVYQDAFDDVHADIRYRLGLDRFEQDLILREQVSPELLEQLGLNPKTARLFLLTEFLEPPSPVSVSKPVRSGQGRFLADEELGFGEMRIGRGSAFSLEDEQRGFEAPVGKEWLDLDGRRFLLEQVEYLDVLEPLQRLPLPDQARAGAIQSKARRLANIGNGKNFREARSQSFPAMRSEVLQPRSVARSAVKPSSQLAKAPGLVLDYVITINTGLANYTFKSGYTYSLTTAITATGMTTFEPSVVLKYARGTKLTVSGPLAWKAEAYRPVILTGCDDPTVGGQVGTAAFTNSYADIALELTSTTPPVSVRDLHIRNAKTAIKITGGSSNVLSHLQMINCQVGLQATSSGVMLRNGLLVNVLTNLTGSSSTVQAEHLTVDGGSWLNHNSALTLSLVNSIVTGVTNLGTISSTCTTIYGSSAGVFQSVGAGGHYLSAWSPLRNVGTTSINATLSSELRDRTTEAPQVRSDVVTSDTTFGPLVWRDRDTPDLGYHYDPIDYAVGYLTVTNATLNITVTNTAATNLVFPTTIAHFGPYAGGIWLRGSSHLCVEGTPKNLIRFTRFDAIQEQPFQWGGSLTNTTGILHVAPQTLGALGFRFARFDAIPLPVPTYFMYLEASSWGLDRLMVRDSEVFLAGLTLSGTLANEKPKVSLINSYFEGSAIVLSRYLQLEMYNNLIRRGDITFDCQNSSPLWTVKDTVFESATITDWGLRFDGNYNAYIAATNRLQSTDGNDRVLSSFTYGTGPFGACYQVSANLLNQGSRLASAAQLSHYTALTTDQSTEGTSQVDIGYHYVGASGQEPRDSDANGVPDYVATRTATCYCEGVTNTPPSVRFLSPTDGSVSAWQTNMVMVLEASADDVDGTVSSVQFVYNGTTTTLASPPWLVMWTNPPSGALTLTARAYDNSSASDSTTIVVTNNAPPSVSITTPANRTVFAAGTTSVTLTAQASDTSGISRVDFYRGSTWIGQGSGSGSYTKSWTGLSNDVYAVTARATDNWGTVAESAVCLFTVNPPPTVSITWPTNGAAFKVGTDVTIQASASDANGIAKVDFFAGTNFVGTCTNETTWTTVAKGLKPGKYSLRAQAFDKSKGRGVSTNAVTITVAEQQLIAGKGYWDPAFSLYPTGDGVRLNLVEVGALAVTTNQVVMVGNLHNDFGTGALLENWNMGAWYNDPANGTPEIRALKLRGADLFVGGSFTWNDGYGCVAVVNGTNWAWAGSTLAHTNPTSKPAAHALELFNSELYMGGDFTSAGGDGNIRYVAKLNTNGTSWLRVGNGLNGAVRAFAVLGNTLYVGGDFTSAGTNTSIKYLARLGTNGWERVGTDLNRRVRALAVWRDQLLVGGEFSSAGGDTNAQCIARWDGRQWNSFGRGVGGGVTQQGEDVPPWVNAISVRGDEVYVGGEFNYARNLDANLVANYVAKASWNVTDQTWTWSDMDHGVTWGLPGSDDGGVDTTAATCVNAITIRENGSPATSGSYDVIVGGRLSCAGGLTSYAVARWIVGTNDSPGTNLPTVSIASPANYSCYATNENITLQATGVNVYGGATCAGLAWFVNGACVGSNTVSPGYTVEWTPGTAGSYSITAVVTDTAGRSRASAPVTIMARNASAITALNDLYSNLVNGQANVLNVLTNDTLGTNPAWISSVSQVWCPLGSVGIRSSGGLSTTGTNIIYTPNANTYGTNVFMYTVTNAAGASSSALVTVYVQAKPTVQITSPSDGSTIGVGTGVTVGASAADLDGTVSSLAVWVNGSLWATTNISTFSRAWSTGTAGYYTFTAVAQDSQGNTDKSTPVTIRVTRAGLNYSPQAAISSLATSTTVLNNFTDVTYPVVRDGLVTLTGTAYDPDAADPVSYQILLYRPDDPTNAFANVTPAANAVGWRQGSVLNNNFDPINLSTVPNGVYDLVLVVRGGADVATNQIRILLDTELKIGQLTFSEQDLVIPVGGVSLTLVRKYDSYNPVQGDFGYCWTYALNDMDVSLDETRTDTIAEGGLDPSDSTPSPAFSMRSGGGRNVTLTLPSGRRATFDFTPRYVCGVAHAAWKSPLGVSDTLTMSGVDVIEFIPWLHWKAAGPSTPFEAFDIPGFTLETLDGTKYELSHDSLTSPTGYAYLDSQSVAHYVTPRPGKLKLKKITLRTGDTIEIGSTAVLRRNPEGTQTNALSFVRDSQNRIIEVWDPISLTNGNAAVKYFYNPASGNLTHVLRLQNRSTATYSTNVYRYENPVFTNYITSIDDPRGITIARNEYDDLGRLVKVTDADGRTTTHLHDTTNRVETVTNRLGKQTTYGYDTRGNVTSVVDAIPTTSTFAYDSLNNKTNEVLAGMVTNIYVYDTNCLMTQSIQGGIATNWYTYDKTGQLLSSTSPSGSVTWNYYDACGQLTYSKNEGGGIVFNIYDESTKKLTSSTDASGVTSRYQYDASGNVNAIIRGHYSGSTFTPVSTNGFLYDINGNLTSTTNALGVETRMLYDAQNRVVSTTVAVGKTEEATTQTIYDLSGRVSRSIDALTYVTAFGYDNQGRRVAVTNAFGTSKAQVTLSKYDAEGNLTNVTDNLQRQTDYQYDEMGRQFKTTYPTLTTNVARLTSTSGYDALGRRTAETNVAGLVSRFGYDALGRFTAVTNAFGTNDTIWVTYTYDASGNQIAQTNAMGRVTKFEYDLLGRRTKRILPGTQSESFGYDSAGRLIAHTNFNNVLVSYRYDDMGQLGSKSSGAYSEIYGYSPAGQMTSRTDGSGSFTWVYDWRGRLCTNTTPVGTLIYSYDRNNNLGSMRSLSSSGVNLSYGYDELNRLSSVTNNAWGGTSRYTYDGVGNLQTTLYPTTTVVTNWYEYDSLNRVTNVTWKAGATVLGSFGYQLGAAGNRLGLAEVNGGNRTYSWNYDNVLKLKQEAITGTPSASLGYGYDTVGNRTTRTGSPLVPQTLNFDVNDRLDNDAIPTNANPYFDDQGNTTSYGGTYGYDWASRMTSSPTVSSMVYDADGNRIKKVVGSTTTWYLVATVNPSGYPQVVEEHTGTTPGTVSRRYAYGLDLISQNAASTTVYFGYDGLGSTRFLINAGGGVANTYVYDAYGSLLASTGTTPNNYLYTGEQWDSDLGMYYLRARYYKPDHGRFWTQDTFEGSQSDPLSLHKYLYAADNPVNMVDPSGENSDVISFNISGAMAASLAAFTAASIYEAKTHAIGNLMVAAWNQTTADASSLADAAESALSVARTSVRDLLKQAKEILKQTGRLVQQIKVVPIPKSVIPNVANHVETAQASGHPMILQRVTPAQAAANRRAATGLLGPAGLGKSWDEYPFASGKTPAMVLPARVVAVPWLENSIQGGIISACYRLEKINVGTPYIVVVTP